MRGKKKAFGEPECEEAMCAGVGGVETLERARPRALSV